MTGRYSFRVLVPLVLADAATDASAEAGGRGVGDVDIAEAMQGVLREHYLSATPGDLPALVLTQVGFRVRAAARCCRGADGPGACTSSFVMFFFC